MTPPYRASRQGPHPAPERETLHQENDRLRHEVERLRQQLSERAKKLTDGQQRIADTEKQISDLQRQLGVEATELHHVLQTPRPPMDWRESSESDVGGRRASARSAANPGHGERTGGLRRRRESIKFGPYCRINAGNADMLRREGGKRPLRRHQVTELPPIQAHIIEYRCPGVICPECGKSTKAAIPVEASGQFGPELTALIVHLTVVCRMPRRVVERLLEQALGIEISLGSTQSAGKKPVRRWPDPAWNWNRS